MKTDNRTLFEGIGILAVVVSLLFVAYQIQQANRIAIATTEIEIRNNFSNINELVIGDDIAEILIKARQTQPDLSDVEELKYEALARRLMNNYRAIEIAYFNGMLPESTYNTAFIDAEYNIRTVANLSYI